MRWTTPGAAIQLSVARISDALINDRINLKKATGLFYGLQIAAQFIDRQAHFSARNCVQSSELTPQGDDLAPQEYECDDDEDCNDCPYSDDSDRCIHPDDEDDEESEEDEDGEDEDDEEGKDEEVQDEEDEEGEDDQGEESEDDKDGETAEHSTGRLQKKQVPIPDGLNALRLSLAKVLNERCRSG